MKRYIKYFKEDVDEYKLRDVLLKKYKITGEDFLYESGHKGLVMLTFLPSVKSQAIKFANDFDYNYDIDKNKNIIIFI